RIGTQLAAVRESVVVGEELRFENAEPVEFREEQRGGVADGPHGIIGMRSFPYIELMMRGGEIEVVHVVAPLLDWRAGMGRGVRCAERWRDKDDRDEREQTLS